jgi:phage shock protein PspC (stress-responsive transcriptional regulator)
MSEAPTAPQSPPPADPPPVPRRLTRSSSDKVLAGVAGGLGRYFDIDPIIFRIGFVVLVFAGGAGVLAYLAAWVLVPDDPIPGQAPVDRSRAATIAGAAVLGLAAIVLLGHGVFFLAPPLIGLGLIAVVGVLLWRAAGGNENAASTAAKLGLVLLLLVVAVAGFAAVIVGSAIGGGAAIAGIVIALGVALAVSAFLGGRRWLVLPALILAIPLGFVAAAGIDVKGGGVGDRDYQPTTAAELAKGYQLGIGQMRLDLTHVDLPPGRTPLKLDMGVGSVRMVVPDDVCVASKVKVGAGYARILDRDSGGLDVDWRQSPEESTGVKRLVIDGDVGIGEIQVVNSRSGFSTWDRHMEFDDQFNRRFDTHVGSIDPLSGSDANSACTEAA